MKAKFVSGEIENPADVNDIFTTICQRHGIDPIAKRAEYKTNEVKLIGVIRLASELKIKIELDFSKTPGEITVIYLEGDKQEKAPEAPADDDEFPL